MIITCPSCDTKFNLPDDKVQQGAQLRCSVCKHIFGVPDTSGHMPGQLEDKAAPVKPQSASDEPVRSPATGIRDDEADQMEEREEGDAGYPEEDDTASLSSSSLDLDVNFGSSRRKKKKSGSGKALKIVLVLLVLIVGGAGGAWYFMGDTVRAYLPFLGGQAATSTQDLVSKITLTEVRQYSITNEKLGSLSIIEGKAVNGFAEPRELIKVEATMYDQSGNVLVSKNQMAGTTVSLFQLQVLGEKELEQALGNRIEILSNNTNVPQGGRVPFMIVMPTPAGATEFGVKVIEAKLPPKQ